MASRLISPTRLLYSSPKSILLSSASQDSLTETPLVPAIGALNGSELEGSELSSKQVAWLLASVLVVALCGIAYELIIAAVSSYLLGNSVAQFSITIGLFMFSMGIGSYLSKFIEKDLVIRFVQIEIAVACVGGISAALLFLVFPYYALYKPTMYGLLLIIGTLVGLEIPILTRIMSSSKSFSESIAHVLSLDYLGALIGSVSFPLFLLPSLGLFRSSFAIGLLNLGIAALTLWVLKDTHPRLKKYWIPTALGLVLLVGGLFSASVIAKFAEGQLFADEMIYRSQSPYQRIVVTKHPRNGEIRLYLDGHLQFAQSDEHRYHESLVHPVMSLGGSPKRILVLGGGDGLAMREIFKYPDVEKVDLVDIDPSITSLATTFPAFQRLNQDSMLDERVTLYHEDAFNFVLERAKPWIHAGDAAANLIESAELTGNSDTLLPPRYDRIIADLPDPHSEVLNKLYSREFYRSIHAILDDDGSFVTQSASPVITREAFWCINKTITESNFSVLPYRSFLNSFGEWGFQLACKSGSGFTPESVRLKGVPVRYLDDKVFAASQVFALDDGPVGTPSNSLFEPKLYMLYEMGLAR